MTVWEADMAAALLSAMISHRPLLTSPAGQALEHLLHATGGPQEELARQWEEAQAADDPLPTLLKLSGSLAQHAADDATLRDSLETWLHQHAPAVQETHNSIGGSAHLHGPTIQAGRIDGGVHFHAPDPSPAVVPRQLPPPRAHFVDRIEDIRTLNAHRTPDATRSVQLLVVTGLAGVGKTALLTRWLQQHQSDFPDGQLYADLAAYAPSGPRTAGEVLEHFLRSLGAASIPVEVAERAALWRSMTTGRRLAVMLDNALSAAHVRPLLPNGEGSLVAVTSRNHLSGLLVDGATLHRLEMLTSDASVELLTRHGGGNRIGQDLQATRDVVNLCARLPLALCLAAAQLAVHPRRSLSALANTLSEGQGPIETLRADGEAAVRSALDESYRLLPPDAATTYRRIGLLPCTSYDPPMITAITTLSPQQADRALETLMDSNLLEETANGHYRFHDLVSPHAQHCGQHEETAAAREETQRRFTDWCLATATAAEEILTPSHRTLARTYHHPPAHPLTFTDPTTALEWLRNHQPHLETAVRHSAKAEGHKTCWQLVDAMWPLFLRLRPAQWWVEAHTLGLAAARHCGDRAGQARMLTSGGAGLRNAGRHQEAAHWYTQALQHAEEDNDIKQQAQALNGLGNAHLHLRQLTDAAQHFTRALTLREEIGYRRGAALSRLCLGQVALARDDHEQAAAYLSRAHTDLLTEADAYDAARALAHLGQATTQLGDHERGIRQLKDALAQFQQAGSHHWQARTLEMLGEAAQHHGDTREAHDCYTQAREIYLPLSPSDTQRLEERLQQL
jgi:tetratricopeptide (TPR) repeat protein